MNTTSTPRDQAEQDEHDDTGQATQASYDTTSYDTTGQASDELAEPRPLHRPLQDRMVAGVAAGLADYLGVDVTLVRIALAVLVVVGGSGVALYLAGWLLIPEQGAEQSIAADFMGPRSR
jgi:phage shock protein C